MDKILDQARIMDLANQFTEQAMFNEMDASQVEKKRYDPGTDGYFNITNLHKMGI